MLVENIRTATDSIKRKADLQSRQLSNTKLSSRLQDIAGIGKRLEACIDTINACNSELNGTEALISAGTKAELLSAISDCGRGLNDYTLDDPVITVFRMQIVAIEQQLLIIWNQAAHEYSSGVVSDLAILGDLTTNPKQSQELLAQIKSDCDASPTEALVKRLKKNNEAAQTMVSQFKLNDEIQGFLSKVKSKQASIDDLTPQIISWLQENNLMKKLFISFKNS